MLVVKNLWIVVVFVRGSIREGEKLLLGPLENGMFQEVSVRTVHRNRQPCRLIQAGQAAAIALLDVAREKLRKVSEVTSQLGLKKMK